MKSNNPHLKEVWICPDCDNQFPNDGHSYAECSCKRQLSVEQNVDTVPKDDPNARMHFRSGAVSTSDPLVSFLYDLLRDHVSPGGVEELVRQSPARETFLTNGWLASYAKDVAHRLRRKEEMA